MHALDNYSVRSLNTDWLDALLILRRVGERDIRSIWEAYEPSIEGSGTHRLVEYIAPQNASGRATLAVSLPNDVAKIERVEIMTFAACAGFFLYYYGGNPFLQPRESFLNLCKRAGCCWNNNVVEPRERWRLLDWDTPLHLHPAAHLEDRPICKVCKGRVASGGGSWYRPLEPRVWVQREDLSEEERTALAYNAAVHEECLRYVHRVLLPNHPAPEKS